MAKHARSERNSFLGRGAAFGIGIPLAVLEGDYIRSFADVEPATAADVASALTGRRMPPIVSGFVGRVS